MLNSLSILPQWPKITLVGVVEVTTGWIYWIVKSRWIISTIQQTSIISIYNNTCCLPHSIASGPETSGNWEVVDAHSPKSESRFYLNVCHKVVHSGAAANCPLNASICAVGKSHMGEELFLMVVEIYWLSLCLQIRLIKPSVWAAFCQLLRRPK